MSSDTNFIIRYETNQLPAESNWGVIHLVIRDTVNKESGTRLVLVI